jgi:restriction system protein
VRVLAERIWHASNRQLNPRYTRGCWYLGFKHGLLSRRQGEIVRLTERGQHFLDKPDSGLDVEIDTYEGILVILHLVAEHSAARRSDLLPAYAQFCRNETTTASDTFIKTTLYDRLRNLIDRGYMLSRGHRYEATEAGLAYLGSHVATTVAPGQTPHKGPDLFRMVRELRETARRQLQEYLLGMDPIRFEELIKVLLEEMGYDNVATTAPSNDKGVDVVGTIELGISAVREVVQVKRHKGAIGRPVLDQLRGSLHRFNAVRGTVITTGKFTKGMEQAAFERGAAPITLIDGERLLDLLIEYEIGVTSRQVEYVEFAPEKLLRKIA